MLLPLSSADPPIALATQDRKLFSLGPMMPPEKSLPAMHRVESTVSAFFRANRAINNYTVMRVYDAATEHYRAVSRGTIGKHDLAGLDAALYDRVIEACEDGLRGGFSYEGKSAEALSIEEMRAALRKLRKSVDFWHNESGRTGYLDYIVQYT